MSRPALKIILASPRGFCAGVTRAVRIVDLALKKYGRPVYVRHEIVHNKFVVQTLAERGAVFVNELNEVPDGAVVVFSAHGVPKSVVKEAEARRLHTLDATCPLVEKVHTEARRNTSDGLKTVLIGHRKHPEVIGTMGQVPPDSLMVIETAADIDAIPADWADKLSYVTQTTLSLDETQQILSLLKERFPLLRTPRQNDICYATTNRQNAVKKIAPLCDAVLVVGAPNSSNSKRLVEVAVQSGCKRAFLVQRASEINWNDLDGVTTLGVTAGASAPEVLVTEMLNAAKERFDLSVQECVDTAEKVRFALPKELTE